MNENVMAQMKKYIFCKNGEMIQAQSLSDKTESHTFRI